ncbi:metal ABC transporter solute-binding protein, Zn/Mn family [Kitasatospora cineracea]
MKRPTALLGAAALLLGALTACGPEDAAGSDGKGLRVVTTTEILADLVRQVGGDRVRVDSIVPPGGDPHSYEPTPRDAAKVAEADVTFTNHLLLEEHALIKTIDANAPEGSPNVSLAEAAEACTRLCLLNRTVVADAGPGSLRDPDVWLRTFGVTRTDQLLHSLGVER